MISPPAVPVLKHGFKGAVANFFHQPGSQEISLPRANSHPHYNAAPGEQPIQSLTYIAIAVSTLSAEVEGLFSGQSPLAAEVAAFPAARAQQREMAPAVAEAIRIKKSRRLL